MHSSIQFRHKATSTYGVEGWRQSLIVQLRHTASADSDMCGGALMLDLFGVFFSGGQNVAYRYGMSSQGAGHLPVFFYLRIA